MIFKKALSKQTNEQLLELNRELACELIDCVVGTNLKKTDFISNMDQIVKQEMAVQSAIYEIEIKYSIDQQIL